jgi:hypothetical protein
MSLQIRIMNCHFIRLKRDLSSTVTLCAICTLSSHVLLKLSFPKIHHSSWTILFLESSSHVSPKFNTFCHASPDLLMHLNSKL